MLIECRLIWLHWMGIPSIGNLDHLPNPANPGHATGLIEKDGPNSNFLMEIEMIVSVLLAAV